MNEKLLQQLTDAVWQRLGEKPRAYCIGDVPEDFPFLPVSEPPYEAVVLASLTPAELLQMPNDAVCRALLEGIPVYLHEGGLEHRRYTGHTGKQLRTLLLSKERSLYALGVQSLHKHAKKRLLTAQDVRNLKRTGSPLPAGAVLTPLAQDIWEGKV